MNLFKQYTPKDGYTPLVKPGKDGIEFLEEGILRLPPGGVYRSASEICEVVVVLLGGLANVTDWNTISSVSKAFTLLSAVDDTLTCSGHGLNAPTTVDNVVRAVVSTSGTLPGGQLRIGFAAEDSFDVADAGSGGVLAQHVQHTGANKTAPARNINDRQNSHR